MEVDFSVDTNSEFGREYEPVATDHESEIFAVDTNEDTISEPEGTVTFAQDNAFTFNGTELINADGSSFTKAIEASGNAEAIMTHHEIIRQWDEAQRLNFGGRQEAFLRDETVSDPDGDTIFKTRMWMNPDGTGGYEIRSIRVPASEDENSSNAERGRGDNSEIQFEYPAEQFVDSTETPAGTEIAAQLVASAEVNNQDLHELTETYVENATAETVHKMETVEETVEELAPKLSEERDHEHAYVLSELLMERLPAYDVEEHAVVVLKTSEAAPLAKADDSEAQREQTILSVAAESAHVAPRIVPRAEAAERFPADAIVQISKPREAQSISVEHIRERATEFVERPIPFAPEQAQTIKAETPKNIDTEALLERDQRVAAASEKFRIRRGREMRPAEYRAPVSHHESDEVAESTPRSIAESAVTKMLERFAPAIEEETREVAIEQVRENPIATLEVAPEKPVLDITAESPRSVEVRTEDVMEHTVVSFEAARSEQLARAEIDEVLTAHGLSRTSTVEIAPVNSVESFMSAPSKRPQLTDITTDNQPGIVTKRGPVTMRRAA